MPSTLLPSLARTSNDIVEREPQFFIRHLLWMSSESFDEVAQRVGALSLAPMARERGAYCGHIFRCAVEGHQLSSNTVATVLDPKPAPGERQGVLAVKGADVTIECSAVSPEIVFEKGLLCQF